MGNDSLPAKRNTLLHDDLTDPVTDASSESNVVIGYVDRLATEKNLHHLAPLQDIPGVQLVLVGEGSEQTQLERVLPRERFLNVRQDEELATLLAAFDIFVHPVTPAHSIVRSSASHPTRRSDTNRGCGPI